MPAQLTDSQEGLSSVSKLKRMKDDAMGRTCSTNGDKRNAYRILWETQKETDH
jgi:hypothetical protein